MNNSVIEDYKMAGDDDLLAGGGKPEDATAPIDPMQAVVVNSFHASLRELLPTVQQHIEPKVTAALDRLKLRQQIDEKEQACGVDNALPISELYTYRERVVESWLLKHVSQLTPEQEAEFPLFYVALAVQNVPVPDSYATHYREDSSLRPTPFNASVDQLFSELKEYPMAMAIQVLSMAYAGLSLQFRNLEKLRIGWEIPVDEMEAKLAHILMAMPCYIKTLREKIDKIEDPEQKALMQKQLEKLQHLQFILSTEAVIACQQHKLTCLTIEHKKAFPKEHKNFLNYVEQLDNKLAEYDKYRHRFINLKMSPPRIQAVAAIKKLRHHLFNQVYTRRLKSEAAHRSLAIFVRNQCSLARDEKMQRKWLCKKWRSSGKLSETLGAITKEDDIPQYQPEATDKVANESLTELSLLLATQAKSYLNSKQGGILGCLTHFRPRRQERIKQAESISEWANTANAMTDIKMADIADKLLEIQKNHGLTLFTDSNLLTSLLVVIASEPNYKSVLKTAVSKSKVDSLLKWRIINRLESTDVKDRAKAIQIAPAA